MVLATAKYKALKTIITSVTKVNKTVILNLGNKHKLQNIKEG